MLADLKYDARHAAVGTMLPTDDARFVDESFSSSFFGKLSTLISMLQYTNAALKYLECLREEVLCDNLSCSSK